MGQDKPPGGAGVREGGTRSGTNEAAASSCPPPGSAVTLMSSSSHQVLRAFVLTTFIQK